MADIGLNPPKATNVHSRTGVMTDALAKFGSIVVQAATGNHADMVTTTSAGATGVQGVVTSIGDPNNSDLFAVGDQVSVRDLGDAEVLVVAGTYAVGDPIITSTTAGAGKKLAAETGADIVGYSLQAITLAAVGRISVRLNITRRGS
jgi:hypothetical protein